MSKAAADELGIPRDTFRRAVWDGRLREEQVAPPSVRTDKSERSLQDAEAAEGLGTACTRGGERMLAALRAINGRYPASIRPSSAVRPFGASRNDLRTEQTACLLFADIGLHTSQGKQPEGDHADHRDRNDRCATRHHHFRRRDAQPGDLDPEIEDRHKRKKQSAFCAK